MTKFLAVSIEWGVALCLLGAILNLPWAMWVLVGAGFVILAAACKFIGYAARCWVEAKYYDD